MKSESDTYEIRVSGSLDKRWEAWFEGLVIESCTGKDGRITTTFTGFIPDQAALYGTLARIQSLGISLISVRPLIESEEHKSDEIATLT